MLVQSLTIHSLTNFSGLPGRSSQLLPHHARPAFTALRRGSPALASLARRAVARSFLLIHTSPPSLSFRRGSPESLRGWRRGRDSNPRRVLTRSGFQDRRDRPLCHLSVGRLDLSSHGLFDERSSAIPPFHLSNYPAIQPVPHRLARQEGLEPPTNGFGDRYSAN